MTLEGTQITEFMNWLSNNFEVAEECKWKDRKCQINGMSEGPYTAEKVLHFYRYQKLGVG